MFQGSGFAAPPLPRACAPKGLPPGARLAALWACCAQWGSLDVRKATPGAFFKSTGPQGAPKCAKYSPRAMKMEPISKKFSPKATRGTTFQ